MQNKVSGKPDAAEWAERIWQGFCDDIGVSIKETIANGLADFQRLCKCEHNFDAHRPSIQHRDRTACHICACVEWRPEPAPPAPPAAPAEALAALDKHLPEGYAIGDDATAELAVKLARAESELTDVRRELEDSHARVEALEKALRDYGYHNTDCPAHDNSKACTCGWESARKLL